jgi:HEAT repeat protein
MTHYTLPTLLLLFVSLSATAQPTPPDLRGKTLAANFEELLPGMGSNDSGVRTNAQQRWQDICFALGAPGNEKLRIEACVLMAAKLDAKTPASTRLWLLQQLQRIAHEESLDAITAVLDANDDEVREAAVRALTNNPSPKATEKLIAALALGKSSGKAKIGILNGLGHRGDPTAVEAIAKELSNNDSGIDIAAARALGRIFGEKSLGAIAGAWKGSKGEFRNAISNALLVHADRLLKLGKMSEAKKLYLLVEGPKEPRAVQLAALRGNILTSGDDAGEFVLNILSREDAGERAVAIGQIENLNAAALKTVAESMDKLPVPTRVLVITAIAARGDRSQLPVALAAAKSAETEMKQAGIRALGRFGDASTVEFLLDAMTAKDASAGIAAESLASLPAEGVNEKLIAVLEAEKIAARRVALIGILNQRKADAAVPALLKAAGDADAGVRTAAFSGLKVMALPVHVPDMIAALLKTKGNEREQAELAIVAVSARLLVPEMRALPVLAVLAHAMPKEIEELLPLLGRLGGKLALQYIREKISNSDVPIHNAAVVGLCNWPDSSANDDLIALGEKGNSYAEKERVIKALVRINSVLIDRTNEEKLAVLKVMKKTMELANTVPEHRAVLEGMGNIRHIETLRFVVPYLDQPDYAQAACKGIVELAHSRMLREPNKAEFEKALDRVIAMCKDKGLVERAKQYREGR